MHYLPKREFYSTAETRKPPVVKVGDWLRPAKSTDPNPKTGLRCIYWPSPPRILQKPLD